MTLLVPRRPSLFPRKRLLRPRLAPAWLNTLIRGPGGGLLRGPLGGLANSLDCCCGVCCDLDGDGVDSSLFATLAANCATIDAVVIELVYDTDIDCWEGSSGLLDECTSIELSLCCDQVEPGDCNGLTLLMDSVSCNWTNVVELQSCVCDPLELVYTTILQETGGEEECDCCTDRDEVVTITITK